MRNFASLYFKLLGVAILLWWIWLFVDPGIRAMFFPSWIGWGFVLFLPLDLATVVLCWQPWFASRRKATALLAVSTVVTAGLAIASFAMGGTPGWMGVVAMVFATFMAVAACGSETP